MDPLTHGLVGALSGKSFGTTPRRMWLLVLLSQLPDIDVVFGGFGSWAFWLQHRGITHSIFGVIVQTIFYAWAFKSFDPGPYKIRAFHYFWPLALHVFFDYLTSFGTPVFSPFSFTEYSADLIPQVAFVPVAIMGVCLWLINKSDKTKTFARSAWALLGLYLVLSLPLKFKSMEKGARVAHVPVHASPHLFNPFQWKAIWKAEPFVYRFVALNLLTNYVSSMKDIAYPGNDPAVLASLNSPAIQAFLTVTRWPACRVIKNDDGWFVDWGNLIFSTRGFVRGKLRITVLENGAIVNEENIFDFWSPPLAA